MLGLWPRGHERRLNAFPALSSGRIQAAGERIGDRAHLLGLVALDGGGGRLGLGLPHVTRFENARFGATGRANRVLVVEDDREIADALAAVLAHCGYAVRVEHDGLPALVAAREWNPDLVLLDLRLPTLDGVEVCRRLRDSSTVPVLILTARDSVDERVRGLDAGADDYLTKPFSLSELLARVRAALRRAHLVQAGDRLEVADLALDARTREVIRAGKPVELTAREFDLLEFLLRHSGQVLNRQQIFSEVWGYDYLGDSNVIDVYIRALRQKIDEGFEPRLIQTVRGVGYSLRPKT